MIRRRLLAALIDLALVVGLAVVVVAALAALRAAGLFVARSDFQFGSLAVALVILPATAASAWWEGGPYESTPGKQRLELRVRRLDGERLGRPRAVVRAVIKLCLPTVLAWIAAATMTSSPSPQLDQWMLVGAAVLLPISTLLATAMEEGRPLHDLVSGARVIEVSRAKRAAA